MVYPDLGNLTAWGNDIERELRLGITPNREHSRQGDQTGWGPVPRALSATYRSAKERWISCIVKTLHDLRYAGPFLIEMWTEKAADPFKENRLGA